MVLAEKVDMMWFLEHLFPGFVQGLYANGVARESLARALNGTVTAGTILVLSLFMMIVFRARIIAFLRRFEERRLFTFALVSLTLLSLPDPVFPIRPGLDYSWQWMLNQLAFTYEWGTSVVFTHGPLGWLLYPSWRWITVLVAVAVNIGFCVLWIWSVRRVYLSSEEGRVVAWGLVLSMFFPQMTMEWRWVMLAIVMTRASWLGAGIVAATLMLMKFSQFLVVVGTQVFLLVADRKRRVSCYVAGFLSMLVLLSSLLFPTPATCCECIMGTFQSAFGYNSHMLAEKGVFELMLPIVAFLVLVNRPRHFIAVIPLAPLLYCTAKYNWVRQGIEPFLYALMVVAAFLMGKFMHSRRRFAITAVLFLLIGYGLTWPRYFAANGTYYVFPFGVNPMGIVRTVAMPFAMREERSRSELLLAESKLPANIRRLVGGASVQLLPHELAPAMADSTLRLVPYATIQMYSTYTSWLDAFAANSYSATNAPEFIVVDLSYLAIDDKNAFLDCPRTWAAIRANYSLVDTAESGRWLLLKRRPAPRRIVCDRRLSVPDDTLMEKMIAFFFRGRLHFFEVETTSGGRKLFRVNPAVLKEPVDRDLPLSPSELAGYLSDSSDN